MYKLISSEQVRVAAILEANKWLPSSEIATRANVSRSTATHFTKFLFDNGILDKQLTYPTVYRLSEKRHDSPIWAKLQQVRQIRNPVGGSR